MVSVDADVASVDGPGWRTHGRERVQDFPGLRLLCNSTKNAAHFLGLG